MKFALHNVIYEQSIANPAYDDFRIIIDVQPGARCLYYYVTIPLSQYETRSKRTYKSISDETEHNYVPAVKEYPEFFI